ncbi:MAG: DUF6132 family protein [Candidatus Omnitrophica bacterium]|nr:DUF6132 family protein [Candidatus Omnitrophota bacterium]
MKVVLGIALGAAMGFLIGYFGRCTGSGICPLVRNPWMSTFLGALFGLIVTIGK